ncbi:hypothetical protein GCM10018955_40030 [Planomonospora venezuelensis]
MGRAQRAAGQAPAGQHGGRLLDLRGRAAEHGHGRAVERGHVDLHPFGGEGGADGGLGGGHRDHAAGGGRADEVRPFDHDVQGVLQGEHPGQAGGDVLAEAVADEQVGGDAPVAEQAGQRVLDREEEGVRHRGVAERVAGVVVAVVPAQHGGQVGGRGRLPSGREVRAQVHARVAFHQVGALVHGGGVDGLPGVQLASEPGVVVAHAGEQEGEAGAAGDPVAAAAVAGEGAEPAYGVVEAGADECAAVVELGAAGLQGAGEITERRAGPLLQPAGQPPRLLPQRRRATRRHRHHPGPLLRRAGSGRGGRAPLHRRARRRRGRWSLQDDVGVGAGETEGADAGQGGGVAVR